MDDSEYCTHALSYKRAKALLTVRRGWLLSQVGSELSDGWHLVQRNPLVHLHHYHQDVQLQLRRLVVRLNLKRTLELMHSRRVVTNCSHNKTPN